MFILCCRASKMVKFLGCGQMPNLMLWGHNGVDIPIRSKILKYNVSKCEYTIEYNTIYHLKFTDFEPFSQKYPKLLNSLLAIRIPIFLISWGSTWLARCPINHPVDTYLNWLTKSLIKLSNVWQYTRHPGTSFPSIPTFQNWPIIALSFQCPEWPLFIEL